MARQKTEKDKEAATLAKWFVEKVRGEKWYYPKHKTELGPARSMLQQERFSFPELTFQIEELKACTLALVVGSHVTDGVPLAESKEYSYWCDARGPKGLWVVNKLLYEFYANVPDPPPYWEQPEYDRWVRIFARDQLGVKFTTYMGWDHRGPEYSGIHPDELATFLPLPIVRASLRDWKAVYEKEPPRAKA